MRDNIHRAAPLPKRWKELIEVCVNPAAWKIEGPPRAELALIEDLSFSLDLVRSLQSYLQNPQQNLFDPVTALKNGHFQQQISEKDLLFLSHFERVLGEAISKDPVREALDCAGEEITNSRLRSLDGYLQKEVPHERPNVISRVRASLVEAPREKILDCVTNGQCPVASLKTLRVTPEEDLLK